MSRQEISCYVCNIRSGSQERRGFGSFSNVRMILQMPEMKFTRPHERQDWIRLQLSKLVAARIRKKPSVVEVGMQNIRRWVEDSKCNAHWVAARLEWAELIKRHTTQEIADLLEAEGDEAQRLRSSMPFIQPPFFTEAERLQIIESAYAK